MPQLDSFSFFSQVFWVLFFFTFFYFVNLRQVLPSVASILKVRRRALQKSQTASTNLKSDGDSPLVESHVQFFSLTKLLAPSTLSLDKTTPKFSNTVFIDETFEKEKLASHTSISSVKALQTYMRKIS